MLIDLTKWTWTRVLLNAMLAAQKARPAAALLVTPTLVLRTDNTVIIPESVFADIAVANFSGYADLATTPSDPVNQGASAGGMVLSGTWTAVTASPFVPNTITGVALTDGVTALYGGMEFDVPVNIAGAGDFIGLQAVQGLELAWVG